MRVAEKESRDVLDKLEDEILDALRNGMAWSKIVAETLVGHDATTNGLSSSFFRFVPQGVFQKLGMTKNELIHAARSFVWEGFSKKSFSTVDNFRSFFRKDFRSYFKAVLTNSVKKVIRMQVGWRKIEQKTKTNRENLEREVGKNYGLEQFEWEEAKNFVESVIYRLDATPREKSILWDLCVLEKKQVEIAKERNVERSAVSPVWTKHRESIERAVRIWQLGDES